MDNYIKGLNEKSERVLLENQFDEKIQTLRANKEKLEDFRQTFVEYFAKSANRPIEQLRKEEAVRIVVLIL